MQKMMNQDWKDDIVRNLRSPKLWSSISFDFIFRCLVLNLNFVKGLKYGFCKKLFHYSEVPNRRADRNKRAGLEKSATLLAYLLSKLINEQGGNFLFITWKIVSRVERKSEKSMQACSSIRDLRVARLHRWTFTTLK